MVAPSRTPPWALLRPILQPDERILWLGRPDATRLWSDDEIFIVAVYLAWSAFALLMEIMVTLHGAPLFFSIWGGLYVLGGLYLACGRPALRRRRRARSIYAVTQHRAVAVGIDGSVSQAPLRSQRFNGRLSRDGRRVTVSIGAGNSPRTMGRHTRQPFGWVERPSTGVVFHDVTDINGLLAAIEKAQQPPPTAHR